MAYRTRRTPATLRDDGTIPLSPGEMCHLAIGGHMFTGEPGFQTDGLALAAWKLHGRKIIARGCVDDPECIDVDWDCRFPPSMRPWAWWETEAADFPTAARETWTEADVARRLDLFESLGARLPGERERAAAFQRSRRYPWVTTATR